MREFAHVLGKAVFDSIRPKERQILDRFVAVIASLRAAFKIDALSGEPSFEIGLGEITEPLKTIEEIFIRNPLDHFYVLSISNLLIDICPENHVC